MNLKKIVLPIILIVVFWVVIRKFSFHPLPKEKLQLFKLEIEETYQNNEYQLTIKNPVNCPSRFFLSCEDDEINDLLKGYYPLLLEAKKATIL